MRDRLRQLASPLQQREGRILITADLISGLGDWVGRLALAVLVFERSSSALLAAAVTVISLLPWLGPGQMLATAADRFGRVRTMVTSDLVRAAVFAAMLIHQPVWSLLVLAFIAGLCVPPFEGARASAIVEVTDKDKYPAALALYGMTAQAEILVGYALGGIFIALAGPSTALALNALTFVLSAFILRELRDTAAATPNRRAPLGWRGATQGVRVWRTDPVCARALLLFVGVGMFVILPEALVVPVSADFGAPDAAVGLLAALVAVGVIVGMLFVPSGDDHIALLRRTAVRGLVPAVVAGVILAVSSVPAAIAAAFLVSGIAAAVAVPTNQVVGQRLPKDGRAAAMTVAAGTMYAAQVLSITVAGLLAEVSSARVPLSAGMFTAAVLCLYSALRPIRGSGVIAEAVPA